MDKKLSIYKIPVEFEGLGCVEVIAKDCQDAIDTINDNFKNFSFDAIKNVRGLKTTSSDIKKRELELECWDISYCSKKLKNDNFELFTKMEEQFYEYCDANKDNSEIQKISRAFFRYFAFNFKHVIKDIKCLLNNKHGLNMFNLLNDGYRTIWLDYYKLFSNEDIGEFVKHLINIIER